MTIPTPREALAARALEIPLGAEARAQFALRINALASLRRTGARLDLGDPAIVRILLDELEEHHRGGLGTAAVNGAVIAGLMDAALGFAGALQFGGDRAATVEISVRFLRAAVSGPLEALAITLKRSADLAFTSAELYAGGRLCALADGIVARVTKQVEGEPYW